jgi:5'-nucleotidase
MITRLRERPGAPALLLLVLAVASQSRAREAAQAPPALVTLSIVATSDLHGAAFPRDGAGGLPLLAGYIDNLRAVRTADHGAVLLVDSGDTFQGGIESDLSEGALVVDAYNAMGYTAEALGNHDFDFGSIDSPAARQLPGDLRGALKARAAQARYPFLAANLIDDATGRPVEWPNVRPSVVVEAAGVKVGIVGVMTLDALRSTLAANVRGLHIAPLAPAIAAEAATLRSAGASIVIVAAHAGGRCEQFDRPSDLTSCDAYSEIFETARSLPRGAVDVIAAGHTHGGLAHQVEGIALVEPYSRGQAFGRVDVVVDRASRTVARLRLFPPRQVCARQDAATGNCASAGTPAAVPAQYEGSPVAPDEAIVQAMAPALRRVRTLQAMPLGVSIEAAIRRGGDSGSPLGDLFAEALRAAVPDADLAVVTNATRGLWADIDQGQITFGRLYDVFPFDNRVRRVSVTGAEFAHWVGAEIGQGRGRGLGVSGVAVRPSCTTDGLRVELARTNGRPIHDDDRLIAVTIGAPTLSGGLVSADPLGSVVSDGNAPLVREVVEDWFRGLGRLPHARVEAVVQTAPRVTDQLRAGCAARNE